MLPLKLAIFLQANNNAISLVIRKISETVNGSNNENQ